MRLFGPILLLAVLLAALPGCRRKEEIRVYRVEKEGGSDLSIGSPADPHSGLSGMESPGAALPPGHPTTALPNRVTGKAPEDWGAGKPSTMRQASFLATGQDGEIADISLVILRGTAGGILENVNRWRGELGKAPLEADGLEQAVASLATSMGEAVVVDLEGLAEGSDPGLDGRTVAAILRQPTETWFFKMRGNAALVGAQKQGFLDWVASVQPAAVGAGGVTMPATGGKPEPGPGSTAAADRAKVKWTQPVGWIEGPSNSIRVVTFAVTGPGAATGEVTVVTLAGDGGGSPANLNRWRRQIGLQAVEDGEPAAAIGTVPGARLNLSVVDLAGPGGSTVAAWTIDEGASWYFKLTGPAEVVNAQKEPFMAFLRSIEFVEQ